MNTSSIYVVYLTAYSGSLELPPFYIGSTSKAKIDKGYRGSVSSAQWKVVWRRALELEPHKFRTIILSEHSIRKEALDAEASIHLRLNVVASEHFSNLAVAGVHPRNSGHGRPMSAKTLQALVASNLGAKRSDVTKAKMREAAKSRKPVSEESKAKMRASARTRLRTKHTNETRAKISLAAKSRAPMSQETKAKIAASVSKARSGC